MRNLESRNEHVTKGLGTRCFMRIMLLIEHNVHFWGGLEAAGRINCAWNDKTWLEEDFLVV